MATETLSNVEPDDYPDTWETRDTQEALNQEVAATMASLRESPRTPHTTLHALMLAQHAGRQVTLQELCTWLESDWRDITPDLEILLAAKWITVDEQQKLPTISLIEADA